MIEVQLRGLETVEKYFQQAPERAEKALRFAVNAAATFAAREGKKEIMRQLNFTSAYLGNPSNKDARLRIGQKASAGNLIAVVVAQHRPTSLARFSASPPSFGKPAGPIRVRVKRGKTAAFKRAFFVPLRPGSKAITLDNYNVGLAVRVGPGEQIKNKTVQGKPFKPDTYLLYGPSVEQAFNTVSVDIADDVLSYAEREFLRQYGRDNL